MSGGKGSSKRQKIRRAQAKQASKKAARKQEKILAWLPKISQQDLLNFQFTHFGDDSTPARWFVDPSETINFQPQYDEPDDGLGYYPDGVKRTLTDEQIFMFRRTEVWQRHRAGMQLKEQESEALTQSPSRSVASVEKDIEEASSQSKPPLARSSTQRGGSDRSNSKTPEVTDDWRRRRSEKEVPYDQRHKRKWEQYVVKDDNVEGSLTHRRLVRELDNQQQETIDMDY